MYSKTKNKKVISKNKTLKNKKLELNILYLPKIIIEITDSVCIIIPHRNRIEQLKNIINKLKNTNIDIYVIDQNNGDKFNRGLLLNIGFYIASNTKGKTYDRYIFHDVDSYPDIQLKKQYKIDPLKYKIIHYASPLLDYKYKFTQFFGGVVGFDKNSFKKINGFPNNIFGWGGEDDILRQRVILNDLTIYRPSIGNYELPEHDKPILSELSFKTNNDKWNKILNDNNNWRNNGINQIHDLFITIVQEENLKDFIKNYNYSNINLKYKLLSNIKSFPLINSSKTTKLYYYKIDYLAQHIITPNKNMSILMNKNYVTEERKKRLSKFNGNPIFHNNDNNSPYYNHIEPLIYWYEIEKYIINTYTEPKLAGKIKNMDKKMNEINNLLEFSFDKYNNHNGNLKISKLDLKNTLKHIYYNYNEVLFFRIRNSKIISKYYIFNINSPKIDWYQDLNWTSDNDKEKDKIKLLHKFIFNSNINYYMTLAKPYFLRANGCLLGIESTDYIRELNSSYVKEFVEMLEYSCNNFTMFDCDIIINRKDFPYLTIDNTFSYHHILNNVSIKNPPKKWYPLFSQSSIPNYHLDIPIPSADEWNTINNPPFANHNIEWNKKKNIAFFRGQSTGCGTNIENNIRLKFSFISNEWKQKHPGLIDIGINNLTSRIKAFEQNVSYIDKKKYSFLVKKKLDYIEQMNYKYIFNIPGNGQAYRYPTEFYKGSLILNVSDSKTQKMWFEPLLKNGFNYIHIENIKSIDEQSNNLYKIIKSLNNNDNKSKEIASNGVYFANTYINKETIGLYLFLISYHLNRMIY